MYLRILKAIYGTVEPALLWYKIYVSVLKDMVFQINPHDICVTNKYMNGKKCTIDWYIDYYNVSQVEHDVIDYSIIKVEERFPGLTVTKCNLHTFLGIKIRYLKSRRIAINMR